MSAITRYTIVAMLLAGPAVRAADVNEATEKAMKAASAAVAATVVKIETAGGAEVVGGGKKGPGGPPGVRKGTGPTTGIIVSPDGFIITSTFNFANKPTDIFVTIPHHPRMVARVIANDQTRMLTLLKVEAQNLPTPAPIMKKEVEIGAWAMALGRTQDPDTDHPPSMSIGIVSATNRIWGKAIQTDAKTSPLNYGGPLIGIDGRVFGVIVPASSHGEGETAGVEWYDSGIGFAIPLEDVYAVLPRLKMGKDLRRGLLGITPKGTDTYTTEPVIGGVQPESAAAKAGIKLDDIILEINGKKVSNYSTIQHVLGPMYEGDEIAVKVKRGDKELEFKAVKLQGTATAIAAAFLGLLPMRDDPGPGVEIRYVYPKSPAEQLGLKEGDRIMKIAPSNVPTLLAVQNREVLLNALHHLTPGTEVKIEVKRKAGGKVETLTTRVVAAANELPEKLPLPSSLDRAGEATPKKKDTKDIFPLDMRRERFPSLTLRERFPSLALRVSVAETSPSDTNPKREQGTERFPSLALRVSVAETSPSNTNPKREQGTDTNPKREQETDTNPKREQGLVSADDKKPDEKDEKKPDKPKYETGFLKRVNEALGREYWVFVPDNYNPKRTYGVIVWFHDIAQRGKDGEEMARTFRPFCEDHNFILMGPKSGNAAGWAPSETQLVVQDVQGVLGQYAIDKTRVVAHGIGNGGQMAFYVGFNARDVFRGVAALGSVLGTNPKDVVATQPLSFFISAGDKDPLLKDIVESKDLLLEKRFPVIFREMKESGKEYCDEATFRDMLLWLDSLDRI